MRLCHLIKLVEVQIALTQNMIAGLEEGLRAEITDLKKEMLAEPMALL